MSMYDSVALQALSAFTGANVKTCTKSADTTDGNELNIFNFLPIVFNNNKVETDYAAGFSKSSSDFSKDLFVNMDQFLDPNYDFDYTNLTDDSTYSRGNEPYKRPYGWNRLAIKVLDKYSDGNAWLGPAGWRNHSVDGEWPVSYHGTSMNSAKAIIGSHYIAGSGQVYGRGIYSTYDIDAAAGYSRIFTCKQTGKSYEVLLQNRINPKMRTVCSREEYWLIGIPQGTPSDKEKEIVEKSIRPYGILLKEVR